MRFGVPRVGNGWHPLASLVVLSAFSMRFVVVAAVAAVAVVAAVVAVVVVVVVVVFETVGVVVVVAVNSSSVHTNEMVLSNLVEDKTNSGGNFNGYS